MKKEYRRQNENLKTNHESTKIGKHEKGPSFYETPASFVFSPFRVFVIRGCFRFYTPILPNKQVKTIDHESTLRHRSGQAKIGKHEKMPEVKKEESRIQ